MLADKRKTDIFAHLLCGLIFKRNYNEKGKNHIVLNRFQRIIFEKGFTTATNRFLSHSSYRLRAMHISVCRIVTG